MESYGITKTIPAPTLPFYIRRSIHIELPKAGVLRHSLGACGARSTLCCRKELCYKVCQCMGFDQCPKPIDDLVLLQFNGPFGDFR